MLTPILSKKSKNLDLGWDSFYLHSCVGGKLVLGPLWDFDLSYGNSNEGCEFYTDICRYRQPTGCNPWYVEASKHDGSASLSFSAGTKYTTTSFQSCPNAYCRRQAWFQRLQPQLYKVAIFGTRQNRETEFITRLKTIKSTTSILPSG